MATLQGENLDVNGIRVSIVPTHEWKRALPNRTHFPYIWADIHVGSWDQRQGNDSMPAAQTSDKVFSDGMRRLSRISSLSSRVTVDTISGGSLQMGFENTWQREVDEENKIYYKRVFDDSIPPTKGSQVWYFSENDSSHSSYRGWYRAEVTNVDSQGDMTLNFLDGREPSESIIQSNIYRVDQGNVSIVPMQRIMVFGLNRFDLKPTEESSRRSSVLLPGMSWLDTGELREYYNQLASKSSSALFTGYVSSVTSSRSDARHQLNITAKDVLQWAQYSLINVNPAIIPEDIGLYGRGRLFDQGNQHWQLFQQRFAGMPVPDIIRALIYGLSIVTIRTTVSPRVAPSTDAQTVRTSVSGSRPENFTILAGQQAFLVETYPKVDLDTTSPKLTSNTWGRVVDTSRGISGWIQISDLTFVENSRALTGIGKFTPITKRSDPIYAGFIPNDDVVNLFSQGDRLAILEGEGATVEETQVLKAYNRFFRTNFPSIQSVYQRRLELLRDLTRATHTELYADQDGVVNFHPVRAYLPVDHPIFVIQPEETLSWAFSETDEEVATWVYVTGQVDFNTTPENMIQDFAFAYDEEVARYGMRALQVSNPNIHTVEGAKAHARSLIRRFMANRLQGEVTVVFRPEMRVARNVYVPWMGRVYYVHSVSHRVVWGQTATTTLGLKYGRHPWQPWTPLDFGVKTDAQAAEQVRLKMSSDADGVVDTQGIWVYFDGKKVRQEVRDSFTALRKFASQTLVDPKGNPVNLTVVLGYSPHDPEHRTGYSLDVRVQGVPINPDLYPFNSTSVVTRSKFQYLKDIIVRARQKDLNFWVTNYYDPSVDQGSSHERGVLHLSWKGQSTKEGWTDQAAAEDWEDIKYLAGGDL